MNENVLWPGRRPDGAGPRRNAQLTAGKNELPVVTGAAFDAFAPDYDAGFTGAALGSLLRRRVA